MNIPTPRKSIKDFSPYVPGKSIEDLKNEQDIHTVVKLASNENSWGVSPRALKKIKGELNNINLYPQSINKKLNRKIAEKCCVTLDSVITGNGTDELIELIAKTFLSAPDGDNIVVSKNSFVRYKMAAKLMGGEVKEVDQKNFHIDIHEICRAVDKNTKIVFMDNPCNPVGTVLKKDEIQFMISEFESLKHPPLVVIDEAYYEYVKESQYHSGINFLNSQVPVMVLRTFSKAYGLAGLRIGYGISDPRIIELINRIRPPFNTNRLAQTAALGAIDDENFLNKTFKNTWREKEFMYGALDKLGIEYVPSQTNFILIYAGQNKEEQICREVAKKGIILRPLRGYSLTGYIRITMGNSKVNKILIKELEKYF